MPLRAVGGTVQLCVLFLLTATAAWGAVSVGAPTRDAASVTYPITVAGASGPAIVLLPGDATTAVLTRGTTTISRNGITPFGEAPLGHAVPSFRIDDPHDGERIVLRLQPASASAPRIITDTAVIAQAVDESRIAGIVYGILFTTALLQCVVFWLTRDSTIVAFLIAMAGRAALEAVRDGLLTFRLFGSIELTLVAMDVVEGIAIGAFVFGYLRLDHRTPRSRVVLALTMAVIVITGMVFLFVPALWPFAEPVRTALRIVAAFALAGIAVGRFRAGFTPAAYLLVAIGGNVVTSLYIVAVSRFGPIVPALDPWVFEIGAALPALVFALGIPVRARFVLAERVMLERELREAEFAAEHDPLTGLLNRRGLETWVAVHTIGGASLLFVDLDGFKRVNDRAGHEAGDQVLIAVAGVLSTVVRSGDAVARIGGDEFVVVLERRGAKRAVDVAQRINAGIEALPVADGAVTIGASIGIAEVARDQTFESALAQADAESYRIKAAQGVGR